LITVTGTAILLLLAILMSNGHDIESKRNGKGRD